MLLSGADRNVAIVAGTLLVFFMNRIVATKLDFDCKDGSDPFFIQSTLQWDSYGKDFDLDASFAVVDVCSHEAIDYGKIHFESSQANTAKLPVCLPTDRQVELCFDYIDAPFKISDHKDFMEHGDPCTNLYGRGFNRRELSGSNVCDKFGNPTHGDDPFGKCYSCCSEPIGEKRYCPPTPAPKPQNACTIGVFGSCSLKEFGMCTFNGGGGCGLGTNSTGPGGDSCGVQIAGICQIGPSGEDLCDFEPLMSCSGMFGNSTSCMEMTDLSCFVENGMCYAKGNAVCTVQVE